MGKKEGLVCGGGAFCPESSLRQSAEYRSGKSARDGGDFSWGGEEWERNFLREEKSQEIGM